MSSILITTGTVEYGGPGNVGGSLVRVSCRFEGVCSPEDFVELSNAMVKGMRFEVSK